MVLPVHERVEMAKSAVRDPELQKIADERRRKNLPVYNLNIGDPAIYGLVPPVLSRLERARQVMRPSSYRYAMAHGIPELREAVAADARKRGVMDADSENVIVGTGVSELVDMVGRATLGKGRNILVPRPDYYLYSGLKEYDAEVRYYDLDMAPGKNGEPNLAQVRKQIDANTAAVILKNPDNPTGAVYGEKVLRPFIKAVEEAGKGNVPIISDEIYRMMVFSKRGGKIRNLLRRPERDHTPLASLTDTVPVITFDGVSKNFYAPGDRIGHALFSNFGGKPGEHPWVKAMRGYCAKRLAAPHATQRSYAHDILTRNRWWNRISYNRMNSEVQKRAEHATKSLRGIGFRLNTPRGAFYGSPELSERMKKIWKTDREFIIDALRETGVWMVPLSGFARAPEEGLVRVVALPSVKEQRKIFSVLKNFVDAKLKQHK